MITRLAVGLWSSSGLAAAAEVTATGPDYAGIAALVTACSGLLATIGAFLIGMRRKAEVDDRVVKLLEEMTKKNEEGAP